MTCPRHSLREESYPSVAETAATGGGGEPVYLDLSVIAIKEYSAFPKAPALLEPYHQIVFDLSQTLVAGGVLPLCSRDGCYWWKGEPVYLDLSVIAIKEYSAFPKAPALLEPYHQIVL